MAIWSCGWAVAGKIRYEPVEGDVLFQSLPNGPGLDVVDAIEGATESPYSHCGVVVNKKGKWYVLEAMVPTVQEVPYERWIKRSQGKFAAYRLKEHWRIMIPAWIKEMRRKMGKPYDFRYRMEDDEIYCSELPFDAWKKLTGADMGKIVKLGDLKWQKYRQVILDIEGSEKVPVEREMITPRDLAAAEQLELVLKNGL
ncbi:MAG: YiiX/YebB-like N1pC/P60 family cysteine hydrolase [Roseibacillus sp.]